MSTDPAEELRRQQEEARRQQEEARKRAEEAAAEAARSRQQGGGMSPGAGVGIAKSLMGGGGGASAGGAAGGGAAGGAGAGASGGSSAAGAVSAAGPWALLAATIAVNEYNAKKGGFRAEDDKEYARDLISGKVLSQDVNGRWAPKLFGSSDKFGLGADMKAGAELSSLDLGSTIKNLKQGTIGKLLGKIF